MDHGGRRMGPTLSPGRLPGGSLRVASPRLRVASPGSLCVGPSLARAAGAAVGSRVTLPAALLRAASPNASPLRGRVVSPRAQSPTLMPSMATLATSALGGRHIQGLASGGMVAVSPMGYVASPRTSPIQARASPVRMAPVPMVAHAPVAHAPVAPMLPMAPMAVQNVRRAPSPVSPVQVAAMQRIYAPATRRTRPSVSGWPQVAMVPMSQDRPNATSSPTRLQYQLSGVASPVLHAAPVASPRPDSPLSTTTACHVPLSTPALSERTASPTIYPQLRTHERVRPSPQSQLAEAARASMDSRKDTVPDPLLTAQGSPALLARTPDPPQSRKLSSVLESQPSLASSFFEREDQYTSAKLLRTSSSKRSRGMSPGPVVRPPSPREHQDLPRPVGNDEVMRHFELFCAALSEASIMEQLCKDLAESHALWDDLVLLRPPRTLAQRITSLLSSQVKDEVAADVAVPVPTLPPCHLMGDEEEYHVWWKALLARYGLHGSGDSLCRAGLVSLLTSACRLIRDSFAPESYLRNLRTVRFGAHRLGDRYEDFRLLSPHRLGRSYRCRGRLSFEDRHCSQVRKDRIACPSDELRAEAEVLRSMSHPNLLRVVESFEDFNSVYIISELVDSVRLLTFLTQQGELRESWLSEVLRQVLGAVGFCHARKAVHGHLGAESVGLAAMQDPATSPQVIISELALAGFLQPPGEKRQEQVSFWQRPLSTYTGDVECCSPKQDIWACGCLLYILLSGCMPVQTNDICFGGPFQPPKVPHQIDWANLRHASAQAEALCSRMLESNPAQRPSAEECLCYPWLQPELSTFLGTEVPRAVLDRLVNYDARIRGSKEVVDQVMAELSSRPVSCASSVFAKATLPQHFDGSLESLDDVRLTPLGGVAPLLQLGLSVQSIERIMQTFDLDGRGNVAHGCFVRRCMELAEDHVDRALWHIFVAAHEDHRGVLGAGKLEQVLDGWEISKGRQEDLESARYIRAAMDPELTASEAVRQVAQAGNEVTFEALKEFVMQRHDAACLANARDLGLV